MKINKDELKNNLTISQIETLVADLGGEPRQEGDMLICKTICHGGDSHKLYYYDNTKLFQCWTNCGGFDVFQLIQKIKKVELPIAIRYIADYFDLTKDFSLKERKGEILEDWDIFENYNKNNSLDDNKKDISLKKYDDIIKFLPQPRIPEWEEEYISYKTLEKYNIRFDSSIGSIIIPHYDINGDLIGIRQRTLIKDLEQYGKYRPLTEHGKIYNHPLGYNLYGIDKNKESIEKLKKAIVVESEKGVMQAETYLGENNIVVACCGSNILKYQISLLLSLGVEEIIIGFDKQFQQEGDEEWQKWTEKLTDIHNKYSKYCAISFMFDNQDLLGYKQSPTDAGEEIFWKLFKDRIYI